MQLKLKQLLGAFHFLEALSVFNAAIVCKAGDWWLELPAFLFGEFIDVKILRWHRSAGTDGKFNREPSP